jgi:hypothetical protein
MIVGFNHNIAYQGVGFHVQTEDGGLKRPQLVTLLYHGGTIISSRKTTYADIIKVDNLDHVVEELAKEQHKGMLRSLTRGEFDQRIGELGITLGISAELPADETVASPPASNQVAAENSATESSPMPNSVPPAVTIVEEPIIDKFNQPKRVEEPSLDDLIYAYLTAGQHQTEE